MVRDRSRITGGGVTAGIDFTLSLIAELRGDEAAQGAQLLANTRPNRRSTQGRRKRRRGRSWTPGMPASPTPVPMPNGASRLSPNSCGMSAETCSRKGT